MEDHEDPNHIHYFIVAIAPDGTVVDHNEICEDDLELVHMHGSMPKGSYLTCLSISNCIH